MEVLTQIPLHGFINDVAVGPKAHFCVVAVGQEPRLGRWDRVSKAKNRFGIVQLRRDESDGDSDDEDVSESEPAHKESPESSGGSCSEEETSER